MRLLRNKIVASDIWFGSNPPQSEISDKDTISKGLAILKSVEEAMDGLNTSLALQPTATGLTGLFITFQFVWLPSTSLTDL